ncbi:MAG: CocE/NonD family hydrolase [Jatrophihabitans sp.]|uniref:CocE/NonD family hydrolase n=1 Tax=Jatrophihabitans sp. TaxID=1932789 RepID=UPI0039142F80
MPSSRLPALFGAAGLAAAAAVALTTGGSASADPAYTVQTLHFATLVGPNGDQPCDVVGDLYTPTTATPTTRVPAILTTNGFGGSKDDQAGIGAAFASRGYAVLSYSGLGFGGSACKITLDDPDWDGKAASQLISYLGGDPGIAFTDAAHTTAAPTLDVVVHDTKDHAGVARTDDPRVGMIGGSYGGSIQFATASIDPRLDTIVPLITWNDLSYSLDPNNTDQTVGVSSSTPGAVKTNWAAGFSGKGVLDGLENAQGDPSRLYPCTNFADFVCPALATAGTTGYLQPGDVAALRHASVASFMTKIKIPTLLMQGENDTLFNLNEAAATYKALKAQGTTVKMVWHSWGHSGSTPAPGELNLGAPDPATQYETARVADWFARYLMGQDVDTGPAFAYFRDWVTYSGIATPAYGTSPSFPVGKDKTFYLSGGGALAGTSVVTSGSQTFVTPAFGAPSSINTADVISGYTGQVPQADLPGTFATWTSGALGAPVNVAGAPLVTLRVSAPSAAATQDAGPAGQLVLFVKVLDVAPDGTASLIHGLEAPIRVPDVTKSIAVTLPAIVHQFAAGHSIRLVVAGGSDNYRGGLTSVPVTIGSGAAQTLVLPQVT